MQNINDESLVAYCGLCCADCHGYRGKVADLSRDLRKELRETKFKPFANFISKTGFGKDFKEYDACYKVLGAMVKFRCKKGCKNGGGPPFCKIRNCAKKNSFSGCWECNQFENCDKLQFLEPVHKKAHIKNIKFIKKNDLEKFLKSKRNW